jgi:hypothetical protein
MRVEHTLVGLLLATAAAVTGCQGRLAYNLPPAARIMEPGPGVGGPGPGVIPTAGMYGGPGGMGGGYFPSGPSGYPGGGYPGAYGGDVCQSPAGDSGVEQASFNGDCPPSGGHGRGLLGGILGGHHGMHGGGMSYYDDDGFGMAGFGGTSQIAFLGSDGLEISWDVGGYGMFDAVPLVVPGRQDFYQGAIYRLKLSNIPGRPGVELYPTLEVAPVTPRTDAFLAHSPIPVQFTVEDFDQALSGNFVTKVIFLPDPEFQELAVAGGAAMLDSTRLDPGVDPIAEADHRGSILAIVRIGNKDLESGSGLQRGTEQIVPTSNVVTQAGYQQPMVDAPADEAGGPIYESEVAPAQYAYPCVDGDGNMPLGMPTAGFSPPAVPPNMIAPAPEWGMPISGTPIGLPGPPHIPLGTPAGLQKHVMRNRTRVLIPPPNAKVNISVKQRPGLNYPRPVTHVHVDETRREPLRLLPSWLTNMFHRGQHGAGAGGAGDAGLFPHHGHH